MSSIHQNPDGSISFEGERFRLKERGEHRYEVIRERDGLSLGAFRLRPDLGVEAEGEHRGIVEAVAGVFAGPRGPVPLQ